MDYSADYCQNEFTAGQKPRMMAALTVTRASLLTENGNLSLTPPSTATIDFVATKFVMCSGTTVQFFDRSLCSPNNYIKSIGWPGITFSWTITNNSGTTLTSTDQNPVFTLTVAGTYDATLVITNANGTTSGTKQGIVVVNAAVNAATCTPVNSSPPTGNTGYGIYGVYLNTIAHETDNSYYDIVDGITNASCYGNFTCSQTTILKPSTTYSFGILGSPYNVRTEDFKAFIDYNHDGDFVDAGEQIVFIDNLVGGGAAVYNNFTTPAAPVLDTPLRMRVISGTSTETLTSCSNTIAGQIQDYAIVITNKIASVTIAAAPSTTITYGTNVTFTATPFNGGTTPTYKWYLNGVLQTGFTGATYTNNTLLNGAQVYCVMTSNLAGVISSPATSNTLTMIVTGPPMSDFTENRTLVCAGGTVIYSDRSTFVPTSWAWTFAGGTPGTSASQNPSIVYSTVGSYNTTLIASNGLGTGTTKTYTSLVSVFTAPSAICAGFTRTQAPAVGIGITRVTVNTINNITAYDEGILIDNSCSMISNLTPGSTYSIEVMVGAVNPQWVRVYIDYNGNNVFTDPGETVFAPANGSGLRSGTFIVPLTATTNKLLRMRVITDFLNTTPGSCTTPLEYGQVEDYGIVIGGPGLPISLISLTAQRAGTQQALINWSLGTYSDVYGFYIERSTNGTHFTAIDSILPNLAYSATQTHYSITDHNAPNGITYYRLKTKYIDRSSEYSQAVTLSELNSALDNIYVYPIPVTQDDVKIFYGNITGDIQWELSDVNGKSVTSGVLHTADKTDHIHLPEVSNGIYVLRLITGKQTNVQRITILR